MGPSGEGWPECNGTNTGNKALSLARSHRLLAYATSDSLHPLAYSGEESDSILQGLLYVEVDGKRELPVHISVYKSSIERYAIMRFGASSGKCMHLRNCAVEAVGDSGIVRVHHTNSDDEGKYLLLRVPCPADTQVWLRALSGREEGTEVGGGSTRRQASPASRSPVMPTLEESSGEGENEGS